MADGVSNQCPLKAPAWGEAGPPHPRKGVDNSLQPLIGDRLDTEIINNSKALLKGVLFHCTPPLWRNFLSGMAAHEGYFTKKPLKAIARDYEKLFDQAYRFAGPPALTMAVVDDTARRKLDMIEYFLRRRFATPRDFTRAAGDYKALHRLTSLNNASLTAEDRGFAYLILTRDEHSEDDLREAFRLAWERAIQLLERRGGTLVPLNNPEGNSSERVAYLLMEVLTDKELAHLWHRYFPQAYLEREFQRLGLTDRYRALSTLSNDDLTGRFMDLGARAFDPDLSEAERLAVRREGLVMGALLEGRGIPWIRRSLEKIKAYLTGVFGMMDYEADYFLEAMQAMKNATPLDDHAHSRSFLRKFRLSYRKFIAKPPAERIAEYVLGDIQLWTTYFVNKDVTGLSYPDFEAARRHVMIEMLKRREFPVFKPVDMAAIDQAVDENGVIAVFGLHLKDLLPVKEKIAGEEMTFPDLVARYTELIHVVPGNHGRTTHGIEGQAFGAFATTVVTQPGGLDHPSLFLPLVIHEAAHNRFYAANFDKYLDRWIALVASERYAYAVQRQFLRACPADREQQVASPEAQRAIETAIEICEERLRRANRILELPCEDYQPYLWHSQFDRHLFRGEAQPAYLQPPFFSAEKAARYVASLGVGERQAAWEGFIRNEVFWAMGTVDGDGMGPPDIPAMEKMTAVFRAEAKKLDALAVDAMTRSYPAHHPLTRYLDPGAPVLTLTGGQWQRFKTLAVANTHRQETIERRADSLLRRELLAWLAGLPPERRETIEALVEEIMTKEGSVKKLPAGHPLVQWMIAHDALRKGQEDYSLGELSGGLYDLSLRLHERANLCESM